MLRCFQDNLQRMYHSELYKKLLLSGACGGGGGAKRGGCRYRAKKRNAHSGRTSWESALLPSLRGRLPDTERSRDERSEWYRAAAYSGTLPSGL